MVAYDSWKDYFVSFFVKKDKLFILSPLVLAQKCLVDAINKTRTKACEQHMIPNKK